MSDELDRDPELVEDEQDDDPADEDRYDQLAVASVPFDFEQFELPDDYEVEGDGNA